MDLALELGLPVSEMVSRMTAGEIANWGAYARKHGLPHRRRDIYLAQIAQVTAGGKLSDYLLKSGDAEEETEETAEVTAHNIGAIGGARVHYLKVA